MALPRPEYPRPQFVRKDWLNLNGTWEFEIDAADSGLKRGILDRPLEQKITVPFCPESALSGIGHTDFMAAVWYRRTVRIPKQWGDSRILLHFQACDYDTTVFANGKEVARHRGGFTPFSVDLTGHATAGQDLTLVVRARDNHTLPQPRGKQSMLYENHTCLYTRTTGIWQTVWLEPVPQVSFRRPRITPDLANSSFHIEMPLARHASVAGLTARVTLSDSRGAILRSDTDASLDFAPRLSLKIPASRRRTWSPEDPHLYGLTFELLDRSGHVLDRVESYAGLRSVSIDGMAVKLNGQTVFQRLVLDQGFYPDGILTAPSDKALKQDIELSIKAGFNGARLHQKVFEERFLYWADKLGYLVWGEFPDWGCGGFGREDDHQQPPASYITQWLEAIERDYSHPAIVGWCPLNETWQAITDKIQVLDDVTRGMFLAAKALDTTRPVLDTSGYAHRVPETDIYDCHDYTQPPEKFAGNQAGLADGKPYQNLAPRNQVQNVPYAGQPFFVSEFGGIWWNPDAKPSDYSWGYGDRPKTLDEFYARFEGQCNALLENPLMFGYCYTQLTDVYQEQNGIYRFDRTSKFDLKKIRAIQTKRAAIEEKREGKARAKGKGRAKVMA